MVMSRTSTSVGHRETALYCVALAQAELPSSVSVPVTLDPKLITGVTASSMFSEK